MVSVCSAWGALPLPSQVLGSNAVDVVVVVLPLSSLYLTLNLTYELYYAPRILLVWDSFMYQHVSALRKRYSTGVCASLRVPRCRSGEVAGGRQAEGVTRVVSETPRPRAGKPSEFVYTVPGC